MLDDQNADTASGPSSERAAQARSRIKHRRSRNACQECHSRKIRCNVTERGAPCANCLDSGVSCIIRHRKTAKDARTQSPVAETNQQLLDRCHTFQAFKPEPSPLAERRFSVAHSSVQGNEAILLPPLDQQPWTEASSDLGWTSQNTFPAQSLTLDPGSASTCIDFSHLTDIDDIFAFTRETTLPEFTLADGILPWNDTGVQQYLSPASVHNNPTNELHDSSVTERPISIRVPGLSQPEEDFLRAEGCLQLPPVTLLRQIIWSYFYMVHPNLPVVAEDQVWSLWHGADFRLGSFSFLLFRAMIFAATNFVEPEILSSLDFGSKRDARVALYKQAKLCFDMGIEKDPMALSQSCLLLSYYAPSYNTLRSNRLWVTKAAHYAKIAQADRHYHSRGSDVIKSSLLKRLWWGVIFRDRILSLGLRQSYQVELGSKWRENESILNLEDFESELGKSAVYQLDAQHRILEVVYSTCSLMQHMTEALHIYRDESLEERLENAGHSLPASVTRVHRALTDLRHWYDTAIETFPFPIGLDDAHDTPTICIYANLMFCYYSSAVFALNLFLVMLSEIFPTARSLFAFDQAREGLETANRDIGDRVQEFVQVRLVKHLPISASAFIAVPLILQAINAAAVRGTKTESIEARRLQIFTRTLQAQQAHFDGSDFCADVLSNIVAYAQNDEKFQSSMANWRDGRSGSASDSSALSSASGKVKLDWANLVIRRPRLFLRLMLYLDYALCTGGPPQDDYFPLALR